MKIVKPLPNIYCQGTRLGLSICLTTNGPNDHKIPANSTIGTASFGFLNSNIWRNLILKRFFYNKNTFLNQGLIRVVGEKTI